MASSSTKSILDQILDHKRTEVARQQLKISQAQLEAKAANMPAPRDFAAALRKPGKASLIAEVKKASPSKGVLIENFDPIAIANIYANNGASAISVLTDQRYFQGSLKYLEGIRENFEAAIAADRSFNACPLLRKDFVVDAYQLFEARAYGADAVLLIVAALTDAEIVSLLATTRELGLQALVEVHDEEELDRALAAGADIIGVNNRNLHTFVTSLETTQRIAARLPNQNRPILVSESGIFTPEHVQYVHSLGADAILVGESLVTAPDIAAKVREIAATN